MIVLGEWERIENSFRIEAKCGDEKLGKGTLYCVRQLYSDTHDTKNRIVFESDKAGVRFELNPSKIVNIPNYTKDKAFFAWNENTDAGFVKFLFEAKMEETKTKNGKVSKKENAKKMHFAIDEIIWKTFGRVHMGFRTDPKSGHAYMKKWGMDTPFGKMFNAKCGMGTVRWTSIFLSEAQGAIFKDWPENAHPDYMYEYEKFRLYSGMCANHFGFFKKNEAFKSIKERPTFDEYMASYRFELLCAIRQLYELEDYCKEHENDVDFNTKKVKFYIRISTLDQKLSRKTRKKELTDGYLKTGVEDPITAHKTWARYPNGVTGPKVLADQKRLVKIAMRIENILVMEKNLLKNYINGENRSMNLFQSFYKIYDSGKDFEDHTPKLSSFLRQKINIAFKTISKDKSMKSKVLEEIFDEFRSLYDHENDYDNYIPPFVLDTSIQKAKDDIRRAWQVINEKPRSEFTDIKPFDLRMVEEGEKVMDRFVENQELIKQERFSELTWKVLMRERLIGLEFKENFNVEFIDDRKPTREFEPIDIDELKKQWSKK